MRIMGLDYGSVTVGVAVSDGLLLTAQPVEVIKRKSETKLRQTLARIEALIAEYEVEKNRAWTAEKYEQYVRRARSENRGIQGKTGKENRFGSDLLG